MDTNFQRMEGAEKHLRGAAYIDEAHYRRNDDVPPVFLSSLPLGPQEIARCVREHWNVENSCHWSLDVVFNEDCCLARAGNEAANLRTLRSIVMNYLTDTGKRLGSTDTRMRMMTKAGMSTKYLYSVLGYNPTEV